MYQGFASDVSRTRALFSQFLVRRLAERGLSLAPSHGDILTQLFRHGEMCMRELSHAIGRDPSTVTALTKKLVAQGLVVTHRATDDRRQTTVALTERGRALEPAFRTISEELAATWEKGVSAEELACAVHVLEVVRANLAQAIEKPTDPR